MSYPLWQLNNMDGGTLIALIAILHVYISHLAVGGGLFLVITETIARKRGDMALLVYVKRHTWFFLLLTMVFGGISGVGIWFIIALVQPAATSKLIHEFVFGWATEWVFFIVEIVALLFYHYLFTKLKPGPHLIIGWLYAAAAWLSLAIIHGILSFMLTPGRWLETHNFWDGFFNPGYFPGVVFRTAIALIIAGLFGLVTALRMENRAVRDKLARYCAAWMLWPLLVLAPSGYWYYRVSDAALNGEMLQGFRFAAGFLPTLIWATLLIFAGGLLLLLRMPRALNLVLVVLLLVIGLGWMGAFEYLRENARRPWIIHGYMYTNSIRADQLADVDQRGFLSEAQWVQGGTDEEKGHSLFVNQCLICHTLDGHRALRPRLKKFDDFGMLAQLTGQGKVQTYMPPFAGTEDEKKLLAGYLIHTVMSKPVAKQQATKVEPRDMPAPPAPTLAAGEPAEPQYVLLCWNDLGMHCMTDDNKRWLLLPPANTLLAQLIQRGHPPRVVTADATLSYAIEPAFAHPEKQTDFWNYTKLYFNADLAPGVGIGGKGLTGEFDFDADNGAYTAHFLPVVPYAEDGSFFPYPQFTVEAHGKDGALLASTKVVAPVSTEMGCRNCHGGGWTHAVAGVSDETAEDVLATHDRLSGTDLLKQALAGTPHKCQDCHADPALAAPGLPGILNLSAAMHGFHANYMSHLGAEACGKCHPADPLGATQCMRDVHAGSVACIDCHGTLSEHALGLLRLQQDMHLPAAERLMANLSSEKVPDKAKINPRMPWVNEPDCLNCHQGYTISRADSYNRWTAGFGALYRNRGDGHGMLCIACHSSTHAVYPVHNMYSPVLDNYQPLQYQGVAGPIGMGSRCLVCHTVMPAASGHHRNMLRPPQP
jgi:hypothetical protein